MANLVQVDQSEQVEVFVLVGRELQRVLPNSRSGRRRRTAAPNAKELAAWLGDDAEATVSADWKPTEPVTAGAQWVKPRNQPFELERTTLPSAHFVELDRAVTVPLGKASPQRSTRSREAVSVSAALRLTDRGSVLILCKGRGTAEVRAAQIAAQRNEHNLSDLGKAVVHMQNQSLDVSIRCLWSYDEVSAITTLASPMTCVSA